MLHLRATRSLTPIDLQAVVGLVPSLLAAWRELPFVDGVYVDGTGRARGGLRVVEGRHPDPGVRYLLVSRRSDVEQHEGSPRATDRTEVTVVEDLSSEYFGGAPGGVGPEAFTAALAGLLGDPAGSPV